MEEIWKPCKHDPDYSVSNTGKIRNKHGYIHNQKPHATGYIRVHMKETNVNRSGIQQFLNGKIRICTIRRFYLEICLKTAKGINPFST